MKICISPKGMDSMTGRGAGYCAGFRRMNRVARPCITDYPIDVDEKEILTSQAKFLENQLNDVNKRLKNIDENTNK